MLRISLMALWLCLTFQAISQDTVNQTDARGRKEGFWRKSDTAGHKIYEGHFKEGLPSGEFRYFYPDGKLKTVSMVSEKGRKAVTTSMFQNGNKMAAGRYLDEKRDSTWQFFSETLGTLVSEETYLAGVRTGLSKIFYPEGGLSEQFYYKNGIKDGLWEQYYLDGPLKLRGAYKGGEKQGAFRMLYPSGKVMIEGRYENGHQDGVWIYHDEKGFIVKKETFLRGELLKTETSAK